MFHLLAFGFVIVCKNRIVLPETILSFVFHLNKIVEHSIVCVVINLHYYLLVGADDIAFSTLMS